MLCLIFVTHIGSMPKYPVHAITSEPASTFILRETKKLYALTSACSFSPANSSALASPSAEYIAQVERYACRWPFVLGFAITGTLVFQVALNITGL